MSCSRVNFTLLIYIYITVKSLGYMAPCFDAHLGLLQVSILHKIIYNFVLNLYHSSATTAASFANCVMTQYQLTVQLQTFLSIPITQKCLMSK